MSQPIASFEDLEDLDDQPAPLRPWLRWGKPGIDFLSCGTLLVLASPFIAVAAVLIKATSAGPAFYSQVRLGLHGRAYRMYKLRTMRVDSEAGGRPVWSTGDDPRVTRIGRFLRETHLDELPQLWNVVKGDMSLIGPRPERPEFVEALERAFPRYRERLAVRPGLTGLAQIQLGADTNAGGVRRKLAYDLQYIAQLSLWLDMRIVLGTNFYLLGRLSTAICHELIKYQRRAAEGRVESIEFLESNLVPIRTSEQVADQNAVTPQ